MVVLGFLLLGALAVRQIGSPDLGFHLRTGEHILSGEGWPRTDPFTFTLNDRPYIDTSWGYDVLVALIQRGLGAPGLVFFHALLLVGLFATLYRTARLAPVDPSVLAILFVAGVLASELRFSTRPELVSYLLLALVLHVLHRHAEGRRAPLWTLPLIMLAWANLHSLFVLGWAAIAAVGLGLAIRDRRLDGALVTTALASVALTLVNPYGPRALLFPFTLLTRFQGENLFQRAIGEFISPFDPRLEEVFPFYAGLPFIVAFRALAILSLLAAILSLRRRRFWHALLWLAFAPLAIRMMRNLPLLVVAALPITIWALPLERPLGALRLGRRWRPRLVAAALLVAAAATLVLGARVVTDAYYVESRRTVRFGWTWNRLELPIDAVAFARGAGITGPVLNHLNFGAYLMWALGEPVFIDGRLEVVGEGFYADYLRILADDRAREAAVDRYGIRWIIFPHVLEGDLLARLSRDERWRLVYYDHLAAIFVRSDTPASSLPDPTAGGAGVNPNWIADFHTLPGVSGNPRSSKLARWAAGLTSRREFPSDDAYRGLFHFNRGELDAAGSHFVAAIRRSDGAFFEIYNNLGSTLLLRGRLPQARDCSEVVLHDNPGNRLARERLAVIERQRSRR